MKKQKKGDVKLQYETIVSEYNSSLTSSQTNINTKNRFKLCKDILELIFAFVTVVTIILGFFPQINSFSQDYVAKANAGHIKSQIILADHYYQVGDYANSIYWYKLAIIKKSRYQALAKNNYVYLMQTQRQEYINNVDYAPMLLVQLVEAADLGSHVAKKNIDTLINNYPLLCLNINNDLKRKMERMNIDTNDAGWEYVGRQTFTESQVSTADTKYKFVSVKDELDPNNIYQIRAKITYDVYRHIGDTSNLKYMYEIPIDIR